VRCKRHSLACGPDGRCVLCRKEAVPTARSTPPPRRFTLAVVVAGALLAAGSAIAYRLAPPRMAIPVVAQAAPPIALAAGSIASIGSASNAPSPSNALAREQAFQAFQEELRARDTMPGNSGALAPPEMPPPEPEAPPVESAPPLAPAPPVASASLEGLRVVIYTTSWCPVCKRAKAWMASHGVPYEEHDIEASRDDARMNRTINPRGSIPTFDIEGDVMVGFSEDGLVATMQRAAQRRAARSY
jgi:glutaredoxin